MFFFPPLASNIILVTTRPTTVKRVKAKKASFHFIYSRKLIQEKNVDFFAHNGSEELEKMELPNIPVVI